MVSTSLFTGLSGLRLHQNYIDVIGNNLANVSTAGFRGARATFSDMLSFTMQTGTAPTGTLGGMNPAQIGQGALMSTVDIDTNQGTFQDTGRPLDIALQGRGFFTLTDGQQRFYTRVGTFGIDNSRNLVDLRSGLRVMSSTGDNIVVPTSGTQPAQATTSVTLQGNLPALVTGPLSEIVESAAELNQGNPATATATASGPAAPQFDLQAFAGQTVLVSVDGGAQQTVTFDQATFGAGPVSASTVANVFANIPGLNVQADDANGTVDFGTVALGTEATLQFEDGPQSQGLLASIGLSSSLLAGTESQASATTDLASLTSLNTPYVDGDQLTISGTNPDGSAFSGTFTYGAGNDGTTIGDLVNFLNATVDPSQAQASLTNDGRIRLTATNAAPAEMSLFIGDATTNTGSNDWSEFTVTQAGAGADTAVTSIDIIDSLGVAHTVTMTFTRSATDPSVWNMSAGMDPSEGTISQGNINQIRFNNDGSFNVIGGGNNSLQFDFSNSPSGTQSVTVNLGTSGQFDGVTMMGNTATVAAIDQDGFGPGDLLNAAFDPNGNLVAFYSNGQSEVLETLRISLFNNEAGLMRVGDTMYTESPNSDNAIFTTANTAGAGSVRAGSLENSNVDIAREFVNLIEAQRGFQASARVITTTDEILAELINIVR